MDPERLRQGRRWGLVAAVAFATLGVLLAARPFEPRLTAALDNLLLAAIAAAGALATRGAARRSEGPTRLGWRWVGVALASWTAGQLVWSALALGSPGQTLFPSAADVGYLAYIPCMLLGTSYLVGAAVPPLERARVVLSGAILSVSLFLVTWVYVLAPVYAAGGATPVAQALGLVYPLSDVTVVGVLGTLLLNTPRGFRRPALLLLGGGFTVAAANSTFAVLTAAGAYTPANLSDLVVAAGFLLLGLAPVFADRGPPAPHAGASPGAVSQAMPYAALTLAVFLAVAEPPSLVTEVAVAALGLLVVARQGVSQREQVRLTGLLKASEGRFRALVDKSSDAILVNDAQGVVVYASPAIERILGLKPEQLVGQHFTVDLDAADVEEAKAKFAALLVRPEEPQHMTLKLRRRDSGGERVVEVVASNFVALPSVGGIVINLRDITEAAGAAEAVRRSEERFRALVTNASDAIAVVDATGRVGYASPALSELLGLPPEALQGRSAFEFIVEEDRERAGKALAKVASGPGAAVDLEVTVLRPDGERRVLAVRGSNELSNPAVRGIVANLRDVTEAKRAEEQLALQARMLAAVGQAVIAVDLEGRLTYWNAAAERLLGWTAQETLGMPAERLLPPGLKVRPADRALAAEGWTGVFGLLSKDGTEKRLLITASPLTDAAGRVTGRLGVATDLAERDRAEQAERAVQERELEVRKLQELDQAKGRFLNAAAHELSTPLTPIELELDLLRSGRRGPLTEAQRRAVETLGRNLRQLGRIVRDLLDAARLDAQAGLRDVSFDLAAEAREVASGFARAAEDQRLTLEVQAAEEVRLVGDEAGLRRVLFHLLDNAVKFTPPGGRVVLEVTRGAAEAEVRVADTGPGLTREQIEQELFRPFSQVHDPAQRTRSGTGLGLYICKGLVERAGGRLGVESPGPGHGATFWFTVPLAPPDGGEVQRASAAGASGEDSRESPVSAKTQES